MQITKTIFNTETGEGTDKGYFRMENKADRKQIVFEHDGEHFLYSYVNVNQTCGIMELDETLVFSCDAEGKVTDWDELFMVDGYKSIEDVMEEMEIEDTMSKERL